LDKKQGTTIRVAAYEQQTLKMRLSTLHMLKLQ